MAIVKMMLSREEMVVIVYLEAERMIAYLETGVMILFQQPEGWQPSEYFFKFILLSTLYSLNFI
ncbi:hypothetical protein VV11_022500 [Trichodesmium erythraeum 21-75]|nr:hypothetical protein [Trichodesmium erythraeum 21-75]